MNKIREYRLLDNKHETFLNSLTSLACQIFHVKSCFVSVIDQDTQWFTASCGLELESTPADISFCKHVIKDKLPLIVEDTLLDARFRENPLVTGEPKIRFYVGLPLFIDEEIVGTFCLVDREPRPWTTAEQTLLQQVTVFFAQSVKINLSHHLAYDEHQLLNHAPAALLRWTLSPNMTLNFVSDNLFPLLGIRAENLENTSWRLESYIEAADLNNYLFTIQNHRLGAKHCETEYRIISETGQSQWVKHISTGHFDHQGKLTAINALVLKNARQKYLDQKLQASNERLRLILDAAELATWDWDIQTDVNIHNKRWCHLLGLDSDFVDTSSLFWEKLIHPADQQVFRKKLQCHLSGSTSHFSCQYRMRHIEGYWVWVDTYAKVVAHCSNGKPARLTGIHRDISEQKEAELEKERQQALMQLLNKAQNVFINQLDIKSACLEIFDELLHLAESDFGFIGHVHQIEHRQRLHIVALTDISWNGDSAKHVTYYRENLLFFDNLDNLFGHVVTSGEEVLSNQPSKHHASKGTPAGHPNLIRFMGLPIKSRGKVIGMLGLANKITDYTIRDSALLAPLLDTLGALFYAVELNNARKLAEERLLIQAATDPLTSVANRRAFTEHVMLHYQQTQHFFLAIMDIDFFKKINDSYGHHIGDAVLVKLAQLCKSYLRSDDFLARLGGEEFGIVLLGDDKEELKRLLESLRTGIAEADFSSIQQGLKVTVSIGAVKAQSGNNLAQFEQDMMVADKALYQAKKLGRNKLILMEGTEVI